MSPDGQSVILQLPPYAQLLQDQLTAGLQYDSIADLKLKFGHVFTQADCFPDFFSAFLICNLSGFQHVKIYGESLAARHNLGLLEFSSSASGRGTDQQAECCCCPQCS